MQNEEYDSNIIGYPMNDKISNVLRRHAWRIGCNSFLFQSPTLNSTENKTLESNSFTIIPRDIGLPFTHLYILMSKLMSNKINIRNSLIYKQD